jgi:hypothetical protein
VREPDPVDERVPSAGAPRATLEAPDRFIRLPEAQEYATQRRVGVPPALMEDDTTRQWVLVASVAMALVILCLILALPGQSRSPTPTTTIHPLEAAGPGADLGIPIARRFRSHTVNAAGDQDVLLLAKGGSAALAPLMGAPVTADGVIVRENYDDTAFSVRSRTGEAMIVYVPYRGPTDIALSLTAQRRVTFEGTLHPIPSDLSSIVGVDAAAVAARTGAYLVAVPESIHPVRHLRRS